MAGSSMTFTYDDGQDGKGDRSPYRKVIAAWTSDDTTGAVSGTTRKIVGELVKAVTDPGAAAPTADYDIAITDEDSVNVLTACKTGLGDRHTSNTEEVYFQLLNADTVPLSMAIRPVVCSKLTIAVTNAGNSKNGTVILYYKTN